jgi:hypothetical protein
MSKGAQASMVTASARRAVDADRANTGGARRTVLADAGGRGWSPSAAPAATNGPVALHSFGDVPVRPTAPRQSLPAIGKADDAYEIEAERAADIALAQGPMTKSSAPAAIRTGIRSDAFSEAPLRIQARAEPGGAPQERPELPQQMQSAAPEGRPLPAEQRAFFEQRLGHDFSAVRIHAGPAASAAAASVRAQAFTHGRDIYFGQNFYRPESIAGQRLMAHELAHTVQQRPNVIARRALDTPSNVGAPARSTAPTPPEHLAESVSEDVSQVLINSPSDEGMPAQARPSAAVTPSVGQAAVPSTAAAASRMQAVVRSAASDAEQRAADTGEISEDGRGSGQPPTVAPPSSAGETALAARTALATFDAQLAELSSRRSAEVRFQEVESGSVENLEDRLRREQSAALATAFLGEVGQHVESVIAAARNLPPQLLASLGGATEAIGAAAKAHADVLHGGAETARQQVRAQSSQTRAVVEGKRKESDQNTAQAARSAQDRADAAKNKANGDIDEQAGAQEKVISSSYSLAVPRMMLVGIDAGNLAKATARRKADAWLAQRNGESSLLDGPIHDDRIEAAADAAVEVGDQYAASFQKSGNEQAFKVPESKPEVLGKVTEISGQAKQGLNDQLRQINDGASAFVKSATARTAKVSSGFKSAATASATQTAAALSAAEAQQVAEIASFSDTQSKSLDQTVASGLGSLTDGVAQAVDGLMRSMDDFVASAASMAPPDREELEPALDDVTSQTAATAATMGGQIQTVGPVMQTAIATGRDQSVQMVKEASANAGKLLGSTKQSFSQGATALNRQAVTGFDKLGKGDQKSAEEIGTSAEKGFTEAATNAATAFGQFGQKVDENLALGRQQVLSSLWSTETRAQFNTDMRKYGQQAADKVQPRWKRVLKWVVTIVVIIAVIAVTVLSAGALGPVGVILLGAALGAAAGAVTTIANNLIDGKKWSDGVVKAMIVGAIGGAVGGAGGVVLKGVGSVALKIGLEAGINVIGGITAEVVGSVAVGETVNWTSAVMGALIGAGVGAGLGIAGALRGKIRLGSMVEPVPPPQVRPQIEVPPPSGRVRGLLEQAKILAPRGGSVPEAGVGAISEGAPKPRPPVNVEPAAPPAEAGTVAPESAAPQLSPKPVPAPLSEPGIGVQPEPAGPAQGQAAPRAAAEPVAPRPTPASELPRPVAEPTAPRPQPAEGPAPDNVRPIESAEPGRAGPQRQLRTQRPTTTADEFAARVRAREAARLSAENPPPQPEPQVQRQPVAVAAGAEGYTPQQLEPRIQPAEGTTGSQTTAGGRSPVEVRASAEPPGRGNAPVRQAPTGSTEGAAPARGGARGSEAPSRASPRGAPRRAAFDESRAPRPSSAETPGRSAEVAGPEPGGRGPQSPQPKATEPAPTRRAPAMRRPPADLPEFPQFPESVEARGPQQALDFFRANRARYPKSIQDAIGRARPGNAADAEGIDAMIRGAQVQRANRALGFRPVSERVQTGVDVAGRPVSEPSSPFTRTTKGHTPLVEGTEFERGATLDVKGNPKNLTYEGQTKTGERVQIDDFNFRTRSGKEIKMPLAIKEDPRFFNRNFDKIVSQMRRQAQFTKDWNFTKYEWEMYSVEDAQTAAKALRVLQQDAPTLAEKIKITVIQ